MNKARVKVLTGALLAALILIQIVQPGRTNPASIPSQAMAAHVQVPNDVKSILGKACGDCHSNQTVWPWYSRIAPISWVVVDDVNEGRRHMNFDNWDSWHPVPLLDRPIDMCKEVHEKGMPPFSYRILHRSQQLTPNEIDTLCSWSDAVGPALVEFPASR